MNCIFSLHCNIAHDLSFLFTLTRFVSYYKIFPIYALCHTVHLEPIFYVLYEKKLTETKYATL